MKNTITLFLLGATSASEILGLKRFRTLAKEVAVSYFIPVMAVKTRCTKDLRLESEGPISCFAFAVGDENKAIVNNTINPGNIAKSFYSKKSSIASGIHFGSGPTTLTPNFDQPIDYVIVTALANPKCSISKLRDEEFGSALVGEGSISITRTTSKKDSSGNSLSVSGSYESPNYAGFAPTLEVEASIKHANGYSKSTESSMSLTFNSAHKSSCTPYVVSYGIQCQSSRWRKFFGANGKYMGGERGNSIQRENFIMFDESNGQPTFDIFGCVNLKKHHIPVIRDVRDNRVPEDYYQLQPKVSPLQPLQPATRVEKFKKFICSSASAIPIEKRLSMCDIQQAI